MPERAFNVLFLCTDNSARSIMAEALMTYWGKGRFRAFSDGSHSKGAVHPLALRLLLSLGLPTEGLRSKSWDEFAAPEAPAMDFVFTVSDQAAAETCPAWPGAPMRAHWGVPDPAAVGGSETEQMVAFRRAHRELETRIKLFASLPIVGLDRLALQDRLSDIGADDPLRARE